MLIPRDGEPQLSKTSASAGDLHHSNSLSAWVLNNCGQGFFSPPSMLAHLKLPCPLIQAQPWVTCQAATSEHSWGSCHFTTLKLTDPLSCSDPRGINSSVRQSATTAWPNTRQVYLLLVTLEPGKTQRELSSLCSVPPVLSSRERRNWREHGKREKDFSSTWSGLLMKSIMHLPDWGHGTELCTPPLTTTPTLFKHFWQSDLSSVFNWKNSNSMHPKSSTHLRISLPCFL